MGQQRSGPTGHLAWTAEQYVTLGRSLLDLVLNRPQWVHRIVETIDFIDDRRFSRHVSVDFTIPAWEIYRQCETVLPKGTYIIPVALLSRQRLKRFDIVDESSAALPVLTRPQNQALDDAMLINGKKLVELLEKQLALATVAGGEHALRSPEQSDTRRIVDKLSNDAKLLVNRVTEELKNSFFLCTLIRGCPGDRRVIKYSYEDAPRRFHLAARAKVWPRLLRTVGWLAFPIDIPCPALWYAPSYHVENALPDDLFFESGQLVALPLGTSTRGIANR